MGAAIYGNAGAYGHSISERVVRVRFFDGAAVRVFGNRECEFAYRESVFKRHKEWIVFSAELSLEAGDAAGLRQAAGEILRVRNEKFPVTMKCAGSIFKNLLFDALPESAARQVPAAAVREGKVPAAWFLEQAGAKGMRRGDIHVAAYHANLIYNGGAGTAADLCALIRELKALRSGALRPGTRGRSPVRGLSPRRGRAAKKGNMYWKRQLHEEETALRHEGESEGYSSSQSSAHRGVDRHQSVFPARRNVRELEIRPARRAHQETVHRRDEARRSAH